MIRDKSSMTACIADYLLPLSVRENASDPHDMCLVDRDLLELLVIHA